MANFVTGIRVLCAFILIFCPIFSICFYVFYFLGGISDVLDGAVARYFGKETKLGAQLDTIADIAFYLTVTVKTLPVSDIPLWLIIWIVCIAVIKSFNIIHGFIIYKRFLSEHTVFNKICGAILFCIPVFIEKFSHQALLIILISACAVATFAAVQEGCYIHGGKEIR